MNLSMYTAYALSLDKQHPTEILRHFRERGVIYGDIIEDELEDISLSDYCRYMRDAGMEPDAFVATRDIVTAADNEAGLSVVSGYIDEMHKLSIPMLMLAPTVRSARTAEEFYSTREKMIESFGKLIEYSSGSNIKIMIENQSSTVRPDSKIADIRYLLDNLPSLGFVLDSGNFYCVGEDVIKAYDALSDRLVHAHIKDWRLNAYGAMVRENLPRFEGCAIGEGILPLAELFERLKSDGYKGNVVLEVNACDITLDVLERSCDFLLKSAR